MSDCNTRVEIATTLRRVDTDPARRDMSMRQFALEVGIRIADMPAVRARRVDSAELIGFIYNQYREHPGQLYGDMAAGIVARFDLPEVVR